ncbi:MAG TPA: hypothetical protein VNZ44_17580 [Pyrinomonadaceae bacterium]|nr:hypothetical protein [Pyrinomonadaceae bacterium]
MKSLVKREAPESSYVGIAVAALSPVVMPLLARAKRRVAAEINSRALRAKEGVEALRGETCCGGGNCH